MAHDDAAKKNIEWRRLNILDAAINACICLVKMLERQMLLKEMLMLVAALAELEDDKKVQA